MKWQFQLQTNYKELKYKNFIIFNKLKHSRIYDNIQKMEKFYCVVIDYHETYANRNSIEIIGIYKLKKNAYKQAILYEFEHNKQYARDSYDMEKFENLLKEFDEKFKNWSEETNHDLELFIEKWIDFRENFLKVSYSGISTGYRFNILETMIMD